MPGPATGVQIGTILLPAYDDQPADAFGTRWRLTKLEGWFDGWEGSGAVEQRSQADGAWVSPQYAGPRVVHVSGSMECASWDDVTRAWDRLLAQVPFRQLGSLAVSTGEGTVETQEAMVRQHEKPLLGERYPTWAKFSLSLIAPDPRRYSAVSQTVNLVLPLASGGMAPPLTPPLTIAGSNTVSQATLVNAGTATTYALLTITGPCPPARVVNLTTSEALRVVDPVPAGQTLVIDTLNGTAVNGGQARRVLGTWWGLQPGLNEIAFSADSYDAGAGLSINYRSAWK